MVAITSTNETVTGNYAANNVLVLIARKFNANQLWFDWKNYNSVPWSKYQIKESDMRAKTATFTSPQYIDLTTGTYCVMITTPLHEDFAGIIINVEYDHKTGLYSYQCQDWSRVYQSKFELINSKKSLHRILQFLITRGGVSTIGAVSKTALQEYEKVLSGLRPAYQYEQTYYGGTKNFNPMTIKHDVLIKGKSFIEVIRDFVFGSGAYIDVYFDKYGIIQIEPYTKEDFFNTGLLLTMNEISEAKQKFDTTNIITGVIVESQNKLSAGNTYGGSSVVNLNLTAIFGNLVTNISNPNPQTNNTSSKTKVTKKKSRTTKKNTNPYKTKKKRVWINSDNISGRTADKTFINDIAKLLRKNGWKTKVVGVGSHTHEEGYANVKKGVWFCIYGGADAAVFREACLKTSYRNKLDKNKSRTVIGMRTGVVAGRPCDIRKGGKCYKHLGRAHDDNYSRSGFNGLNYPLSFLTKHKVPIMYASTPKKMVAKFLAGGDNPKAC